jgi:copper resistance protein B
MKQPAINSFLPYTAMKFILTLPLAFALTSAAFAQDTTPVEAREQPADNQPVAKAAPHSGHAMTDMTGGGMTGHAMPPQPTIDPEDAEYEPYTPMSFDVGPYWLLLVDQLEYRMHKGDDLLRWDAEGWYGGDFNRFWFKTEGEQTAQGPSAGSAEIHGYYSRLIAPFWDAQIGLRHDQIWTPGGDSSRTFVAIGLQGFAPYRFDVTPALFISEDGDLSARLTATRDYRISQRLIAQARFETEIAAQDVPKFGVGNGFNYVELGLRLRYEIRREFAPYIGVNWERKLGETETMARQSGEDPNVVSLVAGVRIWF